MYNTEFTANEIELVRIKAVALVDDMKSGIVEPLKVSITNRKLNELAKALGLAKTQVVAINVLSGITCPFASICKAWVVVDDDGKRTVAKGKDCEFTCYMAKLEAVYTNVYEAAKWNTDYIKEISVRRDVIGLAALLLASIWYRSPSIMRKGGVVRWHAGGDFFTKTYVEAAALIAKVAPEIEFFGYSKSPWVVKALTNGKNSAFVHSHGSKYDAKAVEMGVPQSFVRCSDDQYTNVPTACPTSMVSDDYFFVKAQKSFAINVH